MVTCNICGENKPVDDMAHQFRYICKDCWDEVVLVDKENHVFQKDLFY